MLVCVVMVKQTYSCGLVHTTLRFYHTILHFIHKAIEMQILIKDDVTSITAAQENVPLLGLSRPFVVQQHLRDDMSCSTETKT